MIDPVRCSSPLLTAALVAACSAGEVDLEGRPCGADGCLEGYVCHPELQQCVCAVTISCDGGHVCPQTAQVGDACPCVGAFVTCDPEASGCEHGCRTCQADGTWGECSRRLTCSTSAPELCDGFDNDCDGLADEGIYGCSCSPGNTPGAEVCDHRDNDCNTGIDDGLPCRFDSIRSCDGGVESCDPDTCQWSGNCVAPDGTPPGVVTDFTANPGDSQVALTWTYPTDPDLSLCVIRRRVVNPPTHHLAGDLVHVAVAPAPNSPDSSVDEGLTNGVRYVYAAFCRDASGQWNDLLDLTRNADDATPKLALADYPTDFSATDGEDEQSTLSFTMPANAEECRVRRRLGAYPSGSNDGTLMQTFSGAGRQEFVDTNLTNGTVYYYAVFCSNGVEWNETVAAAENADTAAPLDPVPPNPTGFFASDAEDSLSTVIFTMPAVEECRLVRRDNGNYPADQDDGTLVYSFTTPGTVRLVDLGLVNGVQYHYAAFCRDGTTWNSERTPANSDTARPADAVIDVEQVAATGTVDSASVNSDTVSFVANRLYLAVVATRPSIAVSSVTGLGFAWEHVISQCSASNDTRVEVWRAFATSGASGQVRAALEASASGALVAVSRWVGVNSAVPLTGNQASSTSSGDIDCSGGGSSDSWSTSVSTGSTDSVVFGAVAILAAAHTETDSTVEVGEYHFTNDVGVALVSKPGTLTSTIVSGDLGSSVRWAAVGIELAP